MLISDEGEIIRLKLLHSDRVIGKFISFADFILSSSYKDEIDPFVLPCTPKFGSKYLTALTKDNDCKLSIFYLEMDGEHYSINWSGKIPYLSGNQDAIRIEWDKMTTGRYYVNN